MPAARTTRATRSSNRTAADSYPPSSASIARSTTSSANNALKPSIRLTVKAPPSKLRQALSQDADDQLPPNPYQDTPDDTPEPPVRAPRTTRNPRVVVDPESDEDDDVDAPSEEEDEEEEPEEDIDAELLAAEDSEEDAEGDEDADADGDLDMDAPHPPAPVIQTQPKTPARGKFKGKMNVSVSMPPSGPLKSVEDKEAEDEDEELSDLQSDDEDAEGEDDDDLDSDDEGSRSATPDLTKLTRRQRGAFEEFEGGGLMALSNEAQKKKHLTAEEHAMRRAEMARRRKNLSEKRNEEEKMDTINKLLKKPAPKRRTRAEILAAASAAEGTPGAEDGEPEPANPLFVRWVNNAQGSRIGVPQEWLEAPVGEALAQGWKPSPRRMVEEVS